MHCCIKHTKSVLTQQWSHNRFRVGINHQTNRFRMGISYQTNRFRVEINYHTNRFRAVINRSHVLAKSTTMQGKELIPFTVRLLPS